MSKTFLASLALAGFFAFAPPAAAAFLLQDDFNGENGGSSLLNYNALSNWTVSKGTIDLIGNGSWDFYPGNGLYLDMDGTGIDSGGITSRTNFALGTGTYTLSFMLGGSQRWDGTNTVRVALGSVFSEDFTLASNAMLQTFTRTIIVGTAGLGRLSFTQLNARDNMGLILDNVSLASNGGADVSEPATLLLIAGALFIFAGLRRNYGTRAIG
jgi:hypothetical protein